MKIPCKKNDSIHNKNIDILNYNIIQMENLENIEYKSKILYETLYYRDQVTAKHSRNVACYSAKLATIIFKNENIENLHHIKELSYFAGLLHDIGKIKIEDKILKSNEILTEKEFEIMQQHPYYSYKILHKLNFPKELCRIILYHHERYNGSGYPEGLKGGQIPIISQIIGITDSYDALISERSYKTKKSHKEAIETLKSELDLYNEEYLNLFIESLKC